MEVARYLTGFHDCYRVRRGIDKSDLLEIHKAISERNTNKCKIQAIKDKEFVDTFSKEQLDYVIKAPEKPQRREILKG